MERTAAKEQVHIRQLRQWLAFSLVPARQPTVRRLAAVLLQRFVLLVPPIAVCLHSCGFCLGTRLVLARKIERPHALPILNRHVDRARGIPYLIQPDLVIRQPSSQL